MLRSLLTGAAGLLVASLIGAQPEPDPRGAQGEHTAPAPERQRELVRMVRQDCGSCHGMQLTGGLGPALTPPALATKPVEGLAATIFHGRTGTPMPGWRPMLSEAEALWIAQRLQLGFPNE